jgi:chromosomal replication initiation ATPase DnaA
VPTQLKLPFVVEPSFDAEDLLVGQANRDAVTWLMRWPHWHAPVLTVYGPPGCGKSHLAGVFLRRTGGVELSAATIAGTDPDRLLDGIPAAVLEAADRILSPATEHRLLQLYNLAAESGRAVLLTASAPPGRWPVQLADLRSRLASCPAVGISAPDDGMLGAVLIKLFRDRQLAIDEAVVPYLLNRMDRSFEAARTLVAAIDDAALRLGRPVTIPLVRSVLDTAAGADGTFGP